jgi:hypothetical protein
MVKLDYQKTNTAIPWWNKCRKISNKAVKAYNRCLDDEISLDVLNKKCKRQYERLKGHHIDYRTNWNVIIDLLELAGKDISWYTAFEWDS